MTKEQKLEKLEILIAHVEEVQRLCKKLGMRLIDDGQFDLGKRLIANSYFHDNSKFYSIEWAHLTNSDEEDEMVDVARWIHTLHNHHHPEYWDGIKNMPDFAVAEMVCDWKARSSEFGTDVKDWITTKATKRWGFKRGDKVYKKIMFFVDYLLESSF